MQLVLLIPPPPRSATASTELVEVLVVESGSDQLDPASAFALVASALHHVTGEANFIQVSPSSQQVLPTSHSAVIRKTSGTVIVPSRNLLGSFT